MFEGGDYLYPLTAVAPHQTHTIDIRALRDDQVPDANGQTIPFSDKPWASAMVDDRRRRSRFDWAFRTSGRVEGNQRELFVHQLLWQ
jgi:hypothetical protein